MWRRATLRRAMLLALAACAAAVLSVPATIYLESSYSVSTSVVVTAGLLGFFSLLFSRAGRRAVSVSILAAVSIGALSAAVAVPLLLPRDRLMSEAEKRRQCARFRSAVSVARGSSATRIAVADAAGLPPPEGGGHPMFLTEPWTGARELAFEVTTTQLGGEWVGWYATEPVAGHPALALLALDAAHPRDRLVPRTWIERHEVVAARWITEVGHRLLVYRDEAGGTLELRDAMLAVVARASGVGRGEQHLDKAFSNGEGGLYYLTRERQLWHLAAGGQVRRRAIVGVPTERVEALSARPDGICLRTADGVFVLGGDPLRAVPLDLAVVARDNRTTLLFLAFALAASLLALFSLRRPLATVRALRRSPLVGRLRTLDSGAQVLIDERGEEHPIEHVERWLGGEPSPGEVPCVALVARANRPSAGGPYRAGAAPLALSLVIRGTLDDARALARARLLDVAAGAGLALLFTAAPCLLLALGALLDR